MSSSSRWLEPFSVAQNEILCRAKGAHHGPTSDGHQDGRELWETARQREMSLFDAVETCRKCHKIAPFTNFNGNTFSAIARIIVKKPGAEPQKEHIARSLAGHIVAGVASAEEIRAFREFCECLNA